MKELFYITLYIIMLSPPGSETEGSFSLFILHRGRGRWRKGVGELATKMVEHGQAC